MSTKAWELQYTCSVARPAARNTTSNEPCQRTRRRRPCRCPRRAGLDGRAFWEPVEYRFASHVTSRRQPSRHSIGDDPNGRGASTRANGSSVALKAQRDDFMSLKQVSAFSIGELLRAGVPPYTREAASLVAEVCRQVFYADNQIAPTANDILLGSDGSLTISGAGSATAEEQMRALASLLELLLPPLGSTEPDFAVRASLRMLAPRARGMPGLAPISAPEGLAAELSPYATPDPTGVLRELWARGDRALHQYLPSPRSDERVTAAAIRVAVEAREPVDDLPTRRSDDAVAVAVDEPLEAPSAASQRHRRRFWIPLTAAALFTMGFAGGGWLGQRSHEWASRFVARADAHHSTMPSSRHTTPLHRRANSGSAGERAVAAVQGTDTNAAQTQAPPSVSPNTNAGVLIDATDETLHRARPVDRVAEQRGSVHRDRTANRTAAEPIANTNTEAAAPPVTPTLESAANPVATPLASPIRESVPLEEAFTPPPSPPEVSTSPGRRPLAQQKSSRSLPRFIDTPPLIRNSTPMPHERSGRPWINERWPGRSRASSHRSSRSTSATCASSIVGRAPHAGDR